MSGANHNLTLFVSDGLLNSKPDQIALSTINRPPIAKTKGGNIYVAFGDTYTLDASESFDPDGDALTFKWIADQFNDSWALLAETNSPLFETDEENPTFLNRMQLKLIVTDSKSSLSYDEDRENVYNIFFNFNIELTDNGDGTVTSSNGLIWQQADDGNLYSRTDFPTNSYVYCSELELAGYTNWRLPTLAELQMLVDYRFNESTTINTNMFTSTKEDWYLALEPIGNLSQAAVPFFNTLNSERPIRTLGAGKGYVRCVR